MIQIQMKDGTLLVPAVGFKWTMDSDPVRDKKLVVLQEVEKLTAALDAAANEETKVPASVIEGMTGDLVRAYRELRTLMGQPGAQVIVSEETISRIVWGEFAYAVSDGVAPRTDGSGERTEMRALVLLDETSNLRVTVAMERETAKEMGRDLIGTGKIEIARDLPPLPPIQ